MPTNIETFFINGWKNGWQPDLPPSQLPPDAIPDMMNVNIVHGYGLEKRAGYDKITTDVAGDDEAEHVLIQPVFTVSGLHPNFTQQVLYFNEGNAELFVQSLGELLEEYQLGTGTDLVDSTHSIGPYVSGTHNPRCWSLQAITFGDLIYINGLRFNGTSASGATPATEDGTAGVSDLSLPIKYDVQAGTYSRPVIHELNGETTGFPMSRVTFTAYARVFAANLYKSGAEGGGYRYPSRIYWSEEGTTETWETNSFIDVGADDGSEITAAIPFGEQILIFKQNSTWTLLGTDETTFTLYQLDAEIGVEGTYAVASSAGVAYFFDPQSGLWSYDGAKFENLSIPINATMLGELNRMAAFKTVVHINQDRIFVTNPIGEVATDEDDRATRTYIYDMRLKVWYVWDIGWVPNPGEYVIDNTATGVGVTGDRKFYAGAVDHLKGIFKMEQGLNDEGSAIPANFETSWWNPGDVGDRHRIRRLEALSDPDGDAISIEAYREFDETSTWWTATMTPTGTLDEFHTQKQDGDVGLWTWIKFKFIQNTADLEFKINGIGMNLSSRRLLRGSRPELNDDGGDPI